MSPGKTFRPSLARTVPAVLLLAVPAFAQGTPLTVANAGFEDPAIPAGTFETSAAPPGWDVYGSGIDFGFRTIGVLDPAGTTLYTSAVPEGENVGVVFLLDDPQDQTAFADIEAGMQQTLAATLELNTRYTLTVEVGNIGDDPDPPHSQFQFAGFPGYRVELTAGGTTLDADDDTLLPPERGFLTSTVEFTTGGAHALLGQDLGIRLVNLNAAPGLEVNFDDVRLEAQALEPVPALGAPAAFLLGLLLAAAGVHLARRLRPRSRTR